MLLYDLHLFAAIVL